MAGADAPAAHEVEDLEGYQDAVERLLPYFGGRRLGAIMREDVEAYLVSGQLARLHHPRQRKTPRPLSVTTINQTLHVLRFILNDAVDRGQLLVNPANNAKPLPKAGRPERLQYLGPEQIDRLLAVAPEPFATMYRLMVDAGLRRGEALALKVGDIDFASRCLHVRWSRTRQLGADGHYVVLDGPPKTKASATVIEDLAPSTVAALYVLAGDRSERDYVFTNRSGAPFDPDHVSDVFAAHLRLAGIPPVGIHALRHSCATLAIAAGEHPKAIQVRMRHESFDTTMDTYGHLMRGAFEGMGARVEAWLQGRKRETVSNLEDGSL